MNHNINDGGPAFPDGTHSVLRENGMLSETHGMSLRDYFAAHANIGNVDELKTLDGEELLGRDMPDWKSDLRGWCAWWADYRSVLRYIEADAMIKARK